MLYVVHRNARSSILSKTLLGGGGVQSFLTVQGPQTRSGDRLHKYLSGFFPEGTTGLKGVNPFLHLIGGELTIQSDDYQQWPLLSVTGGGDTKWCPSYNG